MNRINALVMKYWVQGYTPIHKMTQDDWDNYKYEYCEEIKNEHNITVGCESPGGMGRQRFFGVIEPYAYKGKLYDYNNFRRAHPKPYNKKNRAMSPRPRGIILCSSWRIW